MKRFARLLGLAVAAVVTGAAAQDGPRYVQFSPSATKGALHAPQGASRSVAFLVVHRTSNFMNHIAARELSKRGFPVLGMNPRFDNNEAAVTFEDIALDVRQGVEFLKKQPGVSKVVLIGHSGGGPTTTYYQAVAENGPGYCQGPGKLVQCPDGVRGAPPADGLVLLDAHPGNTVNALRSLNPAVADEAKPFALDPNLDPFDPKNGFNPSGDSAYAPEFLDRYFKGQARRMNGLIEKAQGLSEAMKRGEHRPSDDDVFVAYRDRARLSDVSTAVDCCTRAPQRLLKDDGSVVTAVVRTVRVPQPENANADASLGTGTLNLTVRSFLSANAIRAEDSAERIDWCSSNNSTPCAVAAIRAPLLTMAMQGHYFIRDGEVIHEHAKSADKEFVVVEGATHGITPCIPCGRATGASYANATRNAFDYVAAWANARF